jgi:Na+/melibiose symporter-like transporter
VTDGPAGSVRLDTASPVAGLRGNRDFRLLWGGQSVSRLGTEVTQLAIPLVAVLTLHGTAVQIAAVTAVEFVPSLLFGLLAGVWVDRARRQRLLVVTDFGRFASVGAIPVIAWLHGLSFPLLYLLVFVTGTLTLLYDLAYQSVLPQVVASGDLIDGNSRLEATRSVAAGAGPLVGGTLVQLLSAPVAVVVDAISYAVSGSCAALMRPTPAATRGTSPRFRAELAEGIRAVRRDRLQLRLAGTAVTSNFFAAAIQALYVLYASRYLRLSPLLIGVTFGAGAIGAVAAAIAMSRAGGWPGPRAAVLSGLALSACGYLLVPVTGSGPKITTVVVLSVASLLGQGGMVVVAARAMAWRQQITPVHLLGRVISVTRTLAFGVLPVGAVSAGLLAEVAGVRTVLVIGALGMLAACGWLIAPTLAADAGRSAADDDDERQDG